MQRNLNPPAIAEHLIYSGAEDSTSAYSESDALDLLVTVP
jgi:hypothetical protein